MAKERFVGHLVGNCCVVAEKGGREGEGDRPGGRTGRGEGNGNAFWSGVAVIDDWVVKGSDLSLRKAI